MKARNRAVPRPAAALLLWAAVLAAGTMAGCSQLLATGRNAVVIGVALDAGPGPDMTLTAQIFHHGGPTGATGGGGGGAATGGGGPSLGQPIILTLAGSGVDFAQAAAAVQAQTDVRIGFWATDMVLIGQGMAEGDVRAPLDALLRDGDFSLLANVAVVEGRAGSLLQSPAPAGTALEIGERLKHSAHTTTGSLPVAFWRFLSRLSTPYSAAWAPALAKTSQGYRSAGTAVFRGGRLAAVLDPQQSAALSWLVKSGGFEPLTFAAPGGVGTVTLDVVGRAKRLRLDGPGSGTIVLTLDARVRQGMGVSLRSVSPALTAAASAAARRQLRTAVERLQAAGADVIGFGELERERDPALVADWPADFARMHLTLDVTVRLRRGPRLI